MGTTYCILRDDDRDLKFCGELLAATDSPQKSGRWTELRLYRTQAGTYVAEQVGRTSWDGEHDRNAAWVCADTDEVIAALGTGWLAKELYEKAGIECVEKIE